MAVEAEATMAAQGGCWSSLPADLVNRVADCLLSTNDLDYYMDLREVCQHWRSYTADPRSNPHDPRFFPTRWVMLEERRDLFAMTRDDGTRLFVNATTGRFVRRRLPLHLLDRDYHLVTSTVGGFLVLAEREPPHAARVLNPFTGCMIRFMAPVPMEGRISAEVVVGATGDLPKLVLVSIFSSTSTSADDDRLFGFYLADPGSEEFLFMETSSAEASELLAVRSRVPLLYGLAAELAPGEMVRVEKNPQQGVRLFRMDSVGRAMMEQQVTSIGSRALFVGDYRCVSIDADRIPSVDANCIYYYTKEDVGMISHVYGFTYDT